MSQQTIPRLKSQARNAKGGQKAARRNIYEGWVNAPALEVRIGITIREFFGGHRGQDVQEEIFCICQLVGYGTPSSCSLVGKLICLIDFGLTGSGANRAYKDLGTERQLELNAAISKALKAQRLALCAPPIAPRAQGDSGFNRKGA